MALHKRDREREREKELCFHKYVFIVQKANTSKEEHPILPLVHPSDLLRQMICWLKSETDQLQTSPARLVPREASSVAGRSREGSQPEGVAPRDIRSARRSTRG